VTHAAADRVLLGGVSGSGYFIFRFLLPRTGEPHSKPSMLRSPILSGYHSSDLLGPRAPRRKRANGAQTFAQIHFRASRSFAGGGARGPSKSLE
jgi:hypothetical protein